MQIFMGPIFMGPVSIIFSLVLVEHSNRRSYYLQICRVSLTSKPFLYSKYISASGYSVIDKLNGPLSKNTYVCVVFD